MKRWITTLAATLLLTGTLGWGSNKSKPSPTQSPAIPKAHGVTNQQKSVKPHGKAKVHPATRHKAHKTGKPPKVKHPKHKG